MEILLFQIFCIIVFSLICTTSIPGVSSTITYPPTTFAFAIAIIFFLTTLLLLIFFVLSLPEHACGRRVSNYVVSKWISI